jgi:hypothetical protein
MQTGQLNSLALAVLTTFSLLFPVRLSADPITVKINDVPNGPPQITVLGAPHGYVIFSGICGLDSIALSPERITSIRT